MTPDERMRRIDTLLSHVWMVRTFLKHSDEVKDDEELAEVHRELYDYMLALGAAAQAGDSAAYLPIAAKKYAKLKRASDLYVEIQPDVSTHMNFQMAASSLKAAVTEIGQLLAE